MPAIDSPVLDGPLLLQSLRSQGCSTKSPGGRVLRSLRGVINFTNLSIATQEVPQYAVYRSLLTLISDSWTT